MKRIDRHYIVDEISSILNFDKGIFYTVKELILRPGNTIRGFIHENRKKLVKPIFFIIICSLVYSIAQQYLSFEAGYIQFNFENREAPITLKMYKWFTQNYGYMNILLAIPITLWIKILFKKYGYNYYEIYILLCYTMGISMLFNTFLGIVETIIDIRLLQFGIFIAIIYNAWAIGQFFDRKKKRSYLKGFLSYLFGMLSSLLIFILMAMILEKFLK